MDLPSNVKRGLVHELNHAIADRNLTELHTHMMGMGNADFWVSEIIETYIPKKVADEGANADVFYLQEDLLVACGLDDSKDPYTRSMELGKLEARMFDGISIESKDRYKVREIDGVEERGLYNMDLVSYLEMEDAATKTFPGPLRALIRNWFEFLDASGRKPMLPDILETCTLRVI
jgi:hypothetical protein